MANEYSRMFYRGEPYTGEAVERYLDGTVIGLRTFVDGFEEGPSKSWYADGSPNHSGLVAKIGRSVSGVNGFRWPSEGTEDVRSARKLGVPQDLG